MKKKVKIGVVGVGYLGRFHAEKYKSLPNVELVGVIDVDRKQADEVAAALDTTAFYSYNDILSKDKVDAVSIVVPTLLHYSIAKDFLSKGIDVLLEKPMTNTLEEADGLIKEAGRRNAILQVGHLERFNAAVMASEGIVNNPLFIESYRLSPFPNRSTDVDVVLDLMIHDIDIIMNFIKSEIESVDAVGAPVITGKVDMANARLRFKNGCVANVTASRGSKEIGKNDTLLEEVKAFINSVITRKPPLVSGEDGRRALEVAQLIQKSIVSSMQKSVSRGSAVFCCLLSAAYCLLYL